LLDNFTNIKIADFGLSNVAYDGDFLRTSCGSPNYAAPEVISGNLYCGPEVDIWSCGVILYALLCGTLPFEDAHMPNQFKKKNSGQIIITSHLSMSAKDLIAKILTVNPLKRLTMDDIKRHNWFVHKLPSYLSLPPASFITQNRNIDNDVVDSVCQTMGVTPKIVTEAVLKSNDKLISRGSMNSLPERHSIGAIATQFQNGLQLQQYMLDSKENKYQLKLDHVEVAYQLYLSQKLKQQQISDVIMARQIEENTPPLAKGRTSPFTFHAGHGGGSNDVTPTSSQPKPANGMLKIALFGTPSPTPQVTSSADASSQSANANRRKWFIGIQSRKDPSQIMFEIYTVLKTLDCVWSKVRTLF
jgi:5'-AMP-activated protein kinase catalytic alpha subunit